MNTLQRLLLASNSPRRLRLLSEAGFEFDVCAPKVAERLDVELTLRELTLLNATRKAIAAARAHPKKVALAADTLVGIDDQILGKPNNAGEAMAMLEQLSGRAHQVCTSVFICHLAQTKSTSFYEISHVLFRRLSRAKIDDYVARVNPMDKAGAYAAQESGSEIIDKITGSYTNVVGLPMERTISALADFGIRPK